MKTSYFLFIIGALLFATSACSDIEADTFPNSNGNGNSDGDSDSDSDSDSDADSDDVNSGSVNCDDGKPLIFKATVRDFKKGTGSDCNIDFNRTETGERAEKGIVKNSLGADGKPIFNKPNGITTSTEANFKQWYNTVAGVNEQFARTIELTKDAVTGSWYFDSDRFFPLKTSEGSGSQGDKDLSGDERNFRFSTEFRMVFTYHAGQKFTFRGDDDVFVFINKQLVIDLGGIHSPLEGSVNLDTLGLTVGNKYPMDIFHADRNPTGSNFRIETNIDCITPVGID